MPDVLITNLSQGTAHLKDDQGRPFTVPCDVTVTVPWDEVSQSASKWRSFITQGTLRVSFQFYSNEKVAYDGNNNPVPIDHPDAQGIPTTKPQGNTGNVVIQTGSAGSHPPFSSTYTRRATPPRVHITNEDSTTPVVITDIRGREHVINPQATLTVPQHTFDPRRLDAMNHSGMITVQGEAVQKATSDYLKFQELSLDHYTKGVPLGGITVFRSATPEDMADTEKLLQGVMGSANESEFEVVMIDLRPDTVSWDDACNAIVQNVGSPRKLIVVLGIEKMRSGRLPGMKENAPDDGITSLVRLFEQTMTTTKDILASQSAVVLVETSCLPMPSQTRREADPCHSVLLSYISHMILYISEGFGEVRKAKRGKGHVIELWDGDDEEDV